MILDIVSNASYGRFNKKFASIAGLTVACYWSSLLEVLERVKTKKTYTDEGFWTVDRKYITANTTLSKEDQLECDKVLTELEVLTKKEDNVIRLNLETYLSLLLEDRKTVIKDIKVVANKQSKQSKREGKREGIINRLQGKITEEDESVRELYFALLDATYEKGLQQISQIQLFQDTINKYTNDPEVKKEILKISISRGYKVAEWAIGIYEKSNGSGARINKQQSTSSGFAEGIEL